MLRTDSELTCTGVCDPNVRVEDFTDGCTLQIKTFQGATTAHVKCRKSQRSRDIEVREHECSRSHPSSVLKQALSLPLSHVRSVTILLLVHSGRRPAYITQGEVTTYIGEDEIMKTKENKYRSHTYHTYIHTTEPRSTHSIGLGYGGLFRIYPGMSPRGLHDHGTHDSDVFFF